MKMLSIFEKVALFIAWGLLSVSCTSLKIVATESGDADSASESDMGTDTASADDSGPDSSDDSGDTGTPIDTGTADTDSASHSDTDSGTESESESETESESESESESDTVSDTASDEMQNCDGSIPVAGARSVNVNGMTRTYVLHVPDTYSGDTGVPLILDFHAITGSGQRQLNDSIYPEYTDGDSVVMAFPDGLDGPSGTAWNIGPCCVYNLDHVDDVAFARAIVADVMADACIDRHRVYAVGTIMGGGLANRLACEASDIFAATVSLSFDLIAETVDDCQPDRPITTLAFRAESDPLIPFNGGAPDIIAGQSVSFLGAMNSFDRWADINRCTGAAVEQGNGCLQYLPTQCPEGVTVMLCTNSGIVHPGDGDIAWNLLKAYSLP